MEVLQIGCTSEAVAKFDISCRTCHKSTMLVLNGVQPQQNLPTQQLPTVVLQSQNQTFGVTEESVEHYPKLNRFTRWKSKP